MLLVVPFETCLPWNVVGALPEMFQTARRSLTKVLDLRRGQSLPIRGGTSTVGSNDRRSTAHSPNSRPGTMPGKHVVVLD